MQTRMHFPGPNMDPWHSVQLGENYRHAESTSLSRHYYGIGEDSFGDILGCHIQAFKEM